MFPPIDRMIREAAKPNMNTGLNLNTPTGRSQLKKANRSITMPFLVAFISSWRAQGIWNQMLLFKKVLRSFSRS